MPSAVPHAAPTAAPDARQRRAFPGLLALEGGLVLSGSLHGSRLPAEGDLVFTTAATGWGEILTDPSYAGQMVVLTHPMAGSYRIARSELESTRVHARGLVVTRLVEPPPGPGVSLDELLARGRHPGDLRDRHAGPDPPAAQRRGAPHDDRARRVRRGRSRRAREGQPGLGVGRPCRRGRRPRAVPDRSRREAARAGGPRRLRRQAVAPDRAQRTGDRGDRAAAGRDACGHRRRGSGPRRAVARSGRPVADGATDRDGSGARSERRRRVGRRSSASASAISCSAWRRVPRPDVWRSATTAATTPSWKRPPAGSTSARTTTKSRSSTARRWERPATASAIAT